MKKRGDAARFRFLARQGAEINYTLNTRGNDCTASEVYVEIGGASVHQDLDRDVDMTSRRGQRDLLAALRSCTDALMDRQETSQHSDRVLRKA